MRAILEHHIKRKKFSHSYLFYGDKEQALKLIEKASRHIFCENLSHCGNCAACKLEFRQNPDFFSYSFDKFQIDASRAIKELVFKKSFAAGGKIFRIEFQEIGREAENSLLKILEEPPPDTYFFLWTPSLENICDTIKSRITPIFSGLSRTEQDETFSRFLEM